MGSWTKQFPRKQKLIAMLRYVIKSKRSRVYRGRYRIGKDPKIHDVSLGTDKKHIAEAALRKLVEEEDIRKPRFDIGVGLAPRLRVARSPNGSTANREETEYPGPPPLQK